MRLVVTALVVATGCHPPGWSDGGEPDAAPAIRPHHNPRSFVPTRPYYSALVAYPDETGAHGSAWSDEAEPL